MSCIILEKVGNYGCEEQVLPVCQRQGLKGEECGNISQKHTGVPLLCSHIRRESQGLICLLKSNVWWINALWDYFSPGCYSRTFPLPATNTDFLGARADMGLREANGRKAGAGGVVWNPCFLQTSYTVKPRSATAPFQQHRFVFLCLWAVSGMLEWTSCLCALVQMLTVKLQRSGSVQVLSERNFYKNFDLS